MLMAKAGNNSLVSGLSACFAFPHTVSASYFADRKHWAERSARLRGKFNVDEVAGKMSEEHLRKARSLFDQMFS